MLGLDQAEEAVGDLRRAFRRRDRCPWDRGFVSQVPRMKSCSVTRPEGCHSSVNATCAGVVVQLSSSDPPGGSMPQIELT